MDKWRVRCRKTLGLIRSHQKLATRNEGGLRIDPEKFFIGLKEFRSVSLGL